LDRVIAFADSLSLHRSQRDIHGVKERREEVCNVAEDLAHYFADDNSNFDFDRFSKATGCSQSPTLGRQAAAAMERERWSSKDAAEFEDQPDFLPYYGSDY